MRLTLAAPVSIVLALALASCGGAQLSARADAVQDLIATARDNGAIRCAPRELALAESHIDFARQEMREGRYYEARTQLDLAGTNAKLAVERSPRERCAPREVAVKPRKPTPKDQDGDGIVDDDDECPTDPEDFDRFQDKDGCPDADNDNDGIPDESDDCPDKPEDADGFQDADGCPDPDNDKDGLADGVDQCPDEAEDVDGFADDDGCPDCDNDGDGVLECPEVVDKCPDQAAPETPDGCPQKYKHVVVTEKKIELKQTVYFDTNKATIKSVSFELLDEVAEALADHPNIVVRIEGHTDSRGSDSKNLKLSQARAESVRAYLIARGVSPERMQAQGFGETIPIADNRTGTGRAQNRRVEFVIIKR